MNEMYTNVLSFSPLCNVQVAEETAHLAPHGVPSNPIPRALSSNRLHDMASDQGYGATYNTTGGNLDIPGAGGNTGGE